MKPSCTAPSILWLFGLSPFGVVAACKDDSGGTATTPATSAGGNSATISSGVASGGTLHDDLLSHGGTSYAVVGGGSGGAGESLPGTAGATSSLSGPAALGGDSGNHGGDTSRSEAATGAVGIEVPAAGAANDAQRLSQTGLYEADMRTLRPGVVPYRPRFELWSDGAEKQRWIYIPAGTTIDTTDPDFWIFPVGTKVWKEFSRGGKTIETRLIERNSSRSYRMVAYIWNDEHSDAIASELGQPNALGSEHDVPSATDCQTCHRNHPGRILGVGAIQLDYEDSGLTLAKLQSQRLLSSPVQHTTLPLESNAEAALGILHSNCGICHNPNTTMPYRVLDLWLRVGVFTDVTATPFYRSSVGIASGTNPDGASPPVLVVPGHPDSSNVLHRMGSRVTNVAMPPLASEVVDTEGLRIVSEFIAGLQ